MLAYIIRRLFYAIPILIGVNLITFFLFNFVNDPVSQARKELGKAAKTENVNLWLQRNGYQQKDGSKRPYYFNTGSADIGYALQFNLADIPAEVKIESADLMLQITAAENTAGSGPLELLDVQLPRPAEINLPPPAPVYQPSNVPGPTLAGDLDGKKGPQAVKITGLGTLVETWRQNSNIDHALMIGTPDSMTVEIASFRNPTMTLRPTLAVRWQEAGKPVIRIINSGQDVVVDRQANSAIARNPQSGLVKHANVLSNGVTATVSDTVFFDKSVRKMYFDFGKSNRQLDITREIWLRAGPSLMVNIPSLILGLMFSLTLAMIVAYLRGSFFDTYSVFLCVVAMSVSIMFYIIGGQYLFAKVLELYPISGYMKDTSAWKFVIMPVVVGFIGGLGGSIRFYRTIFLEEMNKEYVRTARAKGLSEPQVLFRHVLPNSLVPLVTGLVVDLPVIFIGSLVLENFFAIPGLGSYVIQGIQENDTNIVYSMTYLGAVLFIVGLILTDIAYTIVDPRIRLS